ncbi:MAG: hypothetical protein KBB51_03935 [Candidatus Moranbacteria bacterium]|jgi:hypothetical protein|nr:hypothetical protein [Candidatus Moranbacteria bacterium]
MHADSLLKRHLSSFLMAGLVFFAVAYLFMKNDRELDPDYQKDWWTLSFNTLPAPKDLQFTITNHTKTESFTYTIKDGSSILETEKIDVPKGASRTIQPQHLPREPDVTQPRTEREIIAWPTDSPQNTFSIYQK